VGYGGVEAAAEVVGEAGGDAPPRGERHGVLWGGWRRAEGMDGRGRDDGGAVVG
jgi:hypothetical protein